MKTSSALVQSDASFKKPARTRTWTVCHSACHLTLPRCIEAGPSGEKPLPVGCRFEPARQAQPTADSSSTSATGASTTGSATGVAARVAASHSALDTL